MKENGQERILAGFSESQASLTALWWAMDEARLRRAELQLVRVWDPARFPADAIRGIAVNVWVVVALNSAGWLTRIGPAVAHRGAPAYLRGTGLMPDPVGHAFG